MYIFDWQINISFWGKTNDDSVTFIYCKTRREKNASRCNAPLVLLLQLWSLILVQFNKNIHKVVDSIKSDSTARLRHWRQTKIRGITKRKVSQSQQRLNKHQKKIYVNHFLDAVCFSNTVQRCIVVVDVSIVSHSLFCVENCLYVCVCSLLKFIDFRRDIFFFFYVFTSSNKKTDRPK